MTTRSYRPFLTGLVILSVGIIGLIVLVLLKPEPPREKPVTLAPVVETTTVQRSSGHLTVTGTGSVKSAREVNLSAEVAGRVVSVSTSFVSGGRFQAGDTLLTIDRSDYLNAVAVARAEVTQRKLELLLAREESDIARDEWDRIQKRDGTPAPAPSGELGSLVLKEPQVELAEAVLEGAEARLEDAKSRLSRTFITAPFSGNIRARMAEVGQFLGPGAVVASFYGTDHVEITVALQAEKVALLGNVFRNARGSGTPATVHVEYAGKRFDWSGSVDRVEGAIDLATRTYRIVVRVDDPYVVSDDRPPLFVGMFVDVDIRGEQLDTFFDIPREVLRDGNTVWIADSGTLRIAQVRVLQIVEDHVYVDEGIADGDRLVLTTLPVVSDGMSIRVEESR
jgi:RND family efflux transporter MFP subunit